MESPLESPPAGARHPEPSPTAVTRAACPWGGTVAVALLLVAAACSGFTQFREQSSNLRQWLRADEYRRSVALYGEAQPVILEGLRLLAPTDKALLFSNADPILLPYYLFPVKLFQTQTEPFTNRFYFTSPQTPYPEREPESFDVDWQISYIYEQGQISTTFVPLRSGSLEPGARP